MKLKEALILRKPEHAKQEKNKSGVMTLEEAFELRKAKKYIKRTGSPGNYKYVYKITHPGEKKAARAFSEAAAKVRKRIEKQKEVSDNVKQAIQKMAKDTNLSVKQIANKFALPEKQVRGILSGKKKEPSKKKKPVSSKKYMKEYAGDIRKEADELRRMSEKDFKRKKEKYDKERR